MYFNVFICVISRLLAGIFFLRSVKGVTGFLYNLFSKFNFFYQFICSQFKVLSLLFPLASNWGFWGKYWLSQVLCCYWLCKIYLLPRIIPWTAIVTLNFGRTYYLNVKNWLFNLIFSLSILFHLILYRFLHFYNKLPRFWAFFWINFSNNTHF